MSLSSRERKSMQIAHAASAGRALRDRCGLRYAVCPTCEGAGLVPPLLSGDGWGIPCDTCHGKGVVQMNEPKPAKFGALSESLKGGYRNANKRTA